MKEPQKSKIIALLMDYSAGVYQNKEMVDIIESILSPLPHQDGASAEDVLNGCLKESGERMPDWEKEICIKAMHQFAQSEVAKVVAEKDREIELARNQVDELVENVLKQECEIRDALSTSNAHRTRLIEAIRKWIKAWRKDQQEIRRIKSELSKANERINELEETWIGKNNGLPKPDYYKPK